MSRRDLESSPASLAGRRLSKALATCLVAAVALTGCNDPRPGDSQRLPVPTAPVDAADMATEPALVPETSPPADPVAGPVDAPRGPAETYTRWLDALSRRDTETACRLQHPQVTIDLRLQAVQQRRAELGDPCVDFEALLWEDPARSFAIDDIEITQDTGEKATLAVRFAPGSPTPATTVRLEFHRGAWRLTRESPRTVDDADTARWVEAWCDLTVLDSRADIVAAMGDAYGEYTVSDGGDPQLYWAKDPYEFRVFFDPQSDAVLDMIGDYDALSAQEQAELTCPELR
ncbi:hypothetical protein KLP28_00355 [Nocardioidaceae bacterium]|nr:hypothetical protein KLP28_00355 [Nocardioidaceae bacterium]